MFSTRALLSTVVLAFAILTSASPLTVQVEVILDDVKTDLTYPHHTDDKKTTFHCDGLTTIAFPQIGYKPTLERIQGGMNGCVYKFLPGWPFTSGETVGKTPRAASGVWPSGPGSEADTLERIQELYAHTHDARNRDWLVMKKQPGAWLTQTAQYATFARNPATCPTFFMSAYRAVFEDAKNYTATYGCIHAGGIEMNDANVLFEYDTNNQPTAHLVDWAGAYCHDSNKPDAVHNARILCADYAYYSGGPLNDCNGDLTYQQANEFCMSLD